MTQEKQHFSLQQAFGVVHAIVPATESELCAITVFAFMSFCASIIFRKLYVYGGFLDS